MQTIYAKDATEWHKWLKKNYKKEQEVWLVFYKTHTGKESISYPESVIEAIRFGWIDGIRKKVDEEQYIMRFTPRKPKSIWSLVNKKTAEKQIKEATITPEGLAAVENARKNGMWDKAYSIKEGTELPPDFQNALTKNRKAFANFKTFSNSNQFAYIYQVNAVKNEEARAKRIALVVSLLERNIKPYVNGQRSINLYKED
ncbi:MAG: YdeI/OmpD-associated family protein [Taibaiella sp.]|nr:YdeI/OmpD-associated family protein [Taibaiella sp.]